MSNLDTPNLEILRKHKAETTHKIQHFSFNGYETAALEAIRFSKKYFTTWYVKLLEDGYYSYAHGDETEATVACFHCGDDWTNLK